MKRHLIAALFKDALPVRNAPSFTAENEHLFQQLGSFDLDQTEPRIEKLISNIEHELFSFGVMHGSAGCGIGGPVSFNQLGLLVLENNINEMMISVGNLNNVRIEGLTFNFILTYYVWSQMLKQNRMPKFAKYMIDRLHIAYLYQMNVNPNSINSAVFNKFKMHL